MSKSNLEYLNEAKEILNWIKEENKLNFPNINSNNNEERILAKRLKDIKLYLLRPYDYIDKDNYYEELKLIMNEINKIKDESIINKAREILEWKERKNAKEPPSIDSKDEEEKNLAKNLEKLRKYLETVNNKNDKVYLEVNNIIEKIDNNMPLMLKQVMEIKKWMEEHKTNKLPTENSRNQEEVKLAVMLVNINRNLIKPYENLETDEERKEFKEIYPEFEEVKKIMDEIMIDCNVPIYLQNAINIKNWMKENNITRAPRQFSKNNVEVKLANQYYSIKYFLKKYEELSTDKERQDFVKKHPEYEQVKQIMDEISTDKCKESENINENNKDEEEVER